ncbi:MAG: selenium cofactor biosynthesis protein YqeC [Candidatus Bathyarchaeia archaeon]
MNLSEGLMLRPPEIVTFVGGGGKVTAMVRLAEERLALGEKVIITTTTKMFEPEAGFRHKLLICDNPAQFVPKVREALKRVSAVVLATGYATLEKLQGIPLEAAKELLKLEEVSTVLVKGDGAIDRPLKAPAAHEPAIAEGTTLLTPVVGIDALGRPLNERIAHRPQLVSKLMKVEIGGRVTGDAIGVLLSHPEGLMKNAPPNARVIPLINQVESEHQLQAALGIAAVAFRTGPMFLKRILIGHVQSTDPVTRIVDQP